MSISRRWWLILAIAVLPLSAHATSVTINVTDAGSQVWANGTWNVYVVPPAGYPAQPSLNQNGSLNGSGSASVTMATTASLAPAGTVWYVNVCPNASGPCYTTQPTISGGSQTLTVTPPALSIPIATGNIRAYADSEILNPTTGMTYFNVTDSSVHVYNGTAWVPGGGGGGPGQFTTLTCQNFENVRCVDPANKAGWSGTTFEQWVNAALTDAGASGNVLIAPGNYTANTGGIVINSLRQTINCLNNGQEGVIITFSPSVAATLFTVEASSGGAVAYNDTIKGCSIVGTGTAQKIGIKLIDTSQVIIQNVFMDAMTGNNSIGIWVQGRELGLLDRIRINADTPIEIDLDPNVASENFDAWTVRDAYLIPSSAGSSILVEPGTIMFRARFWGIDCVGGVSCVNWNENTAVSGASYNNSFQNVHHEGATAGSTYSFNFARSNAGAARMENLQLDTARAASEVNGFFFQRTDNTTMIDSLYPNASGTAVNADNTNNDCLFLNTFFSTGSTITNACAHSTQSSNQLPIHTVFANGIGGGTTDAIEVYNTTAAAAGAQQNSPIIHFQGQGWKTNATAASEPVDFIEYLTPIQGTSVPNVLWNLKGQTNSGGYNTVMTANYLGDVTVGDSLTSPSLYNATTGSVIWAGGAPIIASGFNTSGFSIGTSNGTAAFTVNVGTSTGTTTGVLTMPSSFAATTGWNCFANNMTRAANIKQTATGTTSVTLTNYATTVATPTNWTNSDVIAVSCFAY